MLSLLDKIIKIIIETNGYQDDCRLSKETAIQKSMFELLLSGTKLGSK